jgi:hypothetical protein
MTDCTFRRKNTPWTCTECGWIYPRPSKKPPRRNCPASPEARLSLLDLLIAELDRADHFTWGPDRLEDVEIRSRLASCIACEEFSHTHCGRNAGGCAGYKRWLLRVTCANPADCEWWD